VSQLNLPFLLAVSVRSTQIDYLSEGARELVFRSVPTTGVGYRARLREPGGWIVYFVILDCVMTKIFSKAL